MTSPSPYILSLDTTSPHCSAAISCGRKIQVEYNFVTRDQLSSVLPPTLDFLLRSVGLKIEDINLFGVAVGPGLFTGIRVGLATLKGLLFDREKPIVPVNTLKALAYKYVKSQYTVVPLIDARRNELYISAYRIENRVMSEIVEPRLIHVEQLDALVQPLGDVHFIGSGVKAHKELIQKHFSKSRIFHRSFYVASEICKLTYSEYRAGRYIQNLQELQPLYLRKPDAEINFRDGSV